MSTWFLFLLTIHLIMTENKFNLETLYAKFISDNKIKEINLPETVLNIMKFTFYCACEETIKLVKNNLMTINQKQALDILNDMEKKLKILLISGLLEFLSNKNN